MFHMTNGRGHIKYKNNVLLIAAYGIETNFYFETRRGICCMEFLDKY